MNNIFFRSDNRVRNGWKVLLYFVLMAILDIAFSEISHQFQSGIANEIVPNNLVPFLGAALATWICLRFERMPFASIGLSIDLKFLRQFTGGLFLGATLLGIIGIGVWLLDGFHLSGYSGISTSILLRSAILFLIGALFEEIAFRGYAFQRGISAMGVVPCQLAFATAFSLAHLGSPALRGHNVVLPLLTIFLAAIMLGYCYLRTGSLALPIGVHMGWNWCQESLGFSVSGRSLDGFWTPVLHARPDWITGGAFGLEGSLICVIVLIAAIAGLHFSTALP